MGYTKGLFCSTLMVGIIVACQASVFAGVKPGSYDVQIKANPVGVAGDTWIFSKNGRFESKGLGIEGSWEDTGGNGFEVVITEQEIKGAVEKNLTSLGLSASDFSLTVKEVKISGTSKGNAIKGDMNTSIRISLKKPVKTTLNTSGSVNFQGKVK